MDTNEDHYDNEPCDELSDSFTIYSTDDEEINNNQFGEDEMREEEMKEAIKACVNQEDDSDDEMTSDENENFEEQNHFPLTTTPLHEFSYIPKNYETKSCGNLSDPYQNIYNLDDENNDNWTYREKNDTVQNLSTKDKMAYIVNALENESPYFTRGFKDILFGSANISNSGVITKENQEAVKVQVRASPAVPIITISNVDSLSYNENMTVSLDTSNNQVTTDICNDTNNETTDTVSSPLATISDSGSCVPIYVVLMPQGTIITKLVNLSTRIKDIVKNIAKKLEIPYGLLIVKLEGQVVGLNDSTLVDLGFKIGHTVPIEITSSDPDNFPIVTELVKKQVETIKAIAVPVFDDETEGYRLVVIEIHSIPYRKPYLGGWKHKVTSIIYHNASSQTPKQLPVNRPPVNSRDTQTYKLHHKVQQTFNDSSTQMTKPYCYVSNVTDRIVIPGIYETADEREKRILKSIIVIQKYWRRWLSNNYANRLRLAKAKYHESMKTIKAMKENDTKLRQKKKLLQRMNPKTKKDFDLLYSALEKWRLEELQRIDDALNGPERKTALYQLLEEESELIAAIERQRKNVVGENKNRNNDLILKKAANVKKWRTENGKEYIMDTLQTQLSRQLYEMYKSLSSSYFTESARLDILLSVKKLVEQNESPLSRDLVELIQREGTMIMRGMQSKVMQGVRQRISTLFLVYCKSPEYNPEIAHLLKFPSDPMSLRGNIYRCRYCDQFLHSDDFPLGIVKFTIRVCCHCLRLNNIACRRKDLSPFAYLLDQLRRSEMELESNLPRMAFLVNRDDIQYLVEMIWDAKSLLSRCSDLYELKLARWNIDEEWSPWNNVVLTLDEAEAHSRLKADEIYGPELMDSVLQKHSVARIYFERLNSLALKLDKRRLLAVCQSTRKFIKT